MRRKEPLIDPLDSVLGYELRRASAAAITTLTTSLVEATGLRTAAMSVLLVVESNPDVSPSETGRCLGIARANITPIVTSLEERGLLRRIQKGRSQALRLTAAGTKMVARLRVIQDAHEAKLAEGLDAKSLEVILRFLQGVRERFPGVGE